MRLLTERDPVIMDNGDLKQLRDVGGGSDPYTLPIASTETLGGIKVGENLTIGEDGTLNASGGGGTDFIFEPVTLTPLAGVASYVSNTYFAFRLGDVLYFSIYIKMVTGSGYIDVFTVEGNNEFTATTSGVSFNAPAFASSENGYGNAYKAAIAGRHDQNILTIINDNSGASYVSAWGALPLKPRS